MIINLTQHKASIEQIEAGVVDLDDARFGALQGALTFNELPSADEIRARAQQVADMAVGYEAAMIGGAPWFMAPLVAALRERGVEPVFAFSRRESVEETLPDGSTRKTAVFRHAGFVPAV